MLEVNKLREESEQVLPAEQDKLEEICHVHKSQLNTTQNRLENIRNSRQLFERAIE